MIADITVIIVILLCIFLGYKRGLIKVAVRILSFIAAIIVALTLYTPISNYIIEDTEIVPNLQNTIETKLYNKEEKKEQEANNLPQMMQNYVNEYTEGVKESTSEFISHELAITVIRIITWIGLFMATKVILLFVRIFTNAIAQIPIIKQFNKIGGTIYGVLEGFVITYTFLAILNAIYPMIGNNNLYKEIQNSHICKAMYENNIILNIIV